MPRKKILIYLTGGVHWIGGVQYTRNLVRALGRVPRRECPPVVLHIGDLNANAGYEEEFGRIPNITVDRCRRPMLKTWLSRFFRMKDPAARLADDCTVAFPVKGPIPAVGRTNVYWVPDFQYKRLPNYFTEEDRGQRDRMYDQMFRQAQILVLSSQAARRDFEEFFAAYRHVQVRVLPFCSVLSREEVAADCVATCARLNLPERFAYVPNQFWQHKGHDTIFAALAQLKRQGVGIPVVCTGSSADYRSTEYFQVLEKQLADHGLTNQVQLLGVLSRTDQIQIFRRAALILQASRFEGWSTVVEDARALGKPIILSDLEVHREQAPPDADYFKPGDSEQLASVLAGRWPHCRPGPSAREAESLRAGDQRALSFARAFLEIAHEAHQLQESARGGRGKHVAA